jgi:hypothetical protein
MDWARERLWITLRILSRPKGTKGFVVLPRRWKVERTLGWIMNARRDVRDYERLPQHSEAHLNRALITVMTRRLTRENPCADALDQEAQALQLIAGAGRIMKGPWTPMHPAQP